LDICVDGWRITASPPGKQSMMTAFAETGYRFGRLAGGAGALLMADQYGWRAAYLSMAALMAIGAAAAILGPEPESDKHRIEEHIGIVETVVAPIRDLYQRLGSLALPTCADRWLPDAWLRLGGDGYAAVQAPALYRRNRMGDEGLRFRHRTCGDIFFRVCRVQVRDHAQHARGHHRRISRPFEPRVAGRTRWKFWAFALAVGVDGFAYAFAQMVLITFMSIIVSKDMAASQFALLTSLCALPGSLLAGTSGFVIKQTGFVAFFAGTSLLGIPVALLAWYVLRKHGMPTWDAEDRDTAPSQGSAPETAA
jgi:MFS transporter, PAT family, beta-lactamase induction signal transducer AmpG